MKKLPVQHSRARFKLYRLPYRTTCSARALLPRVDASFPVVVSDTATVLGHAGVDGGCSDK